MEGAPCLLLLLLSLLHSAAATLTTPEPCELDDQSIHCVCNFSDPRPDWSSAFLCVGAVDVEFHGGGRSLQRYLKRLDPNMDLTQYADLVKTFRVKKLTVTGAQIPAPLLFGVLRILGYSHVVELTLEDIEVTGTPPPPFEEGTGPALSALTLCNVSWVTGGAWLAELQKWLKPGLQVLNIAQTHSLAFSCDQIATFSDLTTLDLSDNPGLGESGLILALCPHKFPALQVLALRNTGMETTTGVCAALTTAGVQPQKLDLSHNSLNHDANAGAPKCVWPSKLNSLNLSFAGLEQVPPGLPAKLSVLDLSCNRLNREPRPEELPKVDNLSLNGNPFLNPVPSSSQDSSKNSGAVSVCAGSSLVVGMSGTLALLQGARSFA